MIEMSCKDKFDLVYAIAKQMETGRKVVLYRRRDYNLDEVKNIQKANQSACSLSNWEVLELINKT